MAIAFNSLVTTTQWHKKSSGDNGNYGHVFLESSVTYLNLTID
ncbi:hypothetical protein [Ignavibacterium album]|nr:hypothetical protein [Ignavibacterium album]